MFGFGRLKQPSGEPLDCGDILAKRRKPVFGEIRQCAELSPIVARFGLHLGEAVTPFLSGLLHHWQKGFKPLNDRRRIDIEGKVEILLARLRGDCLAVAQQWLKNRFAILA
jgi:hypothetical protein